MKRTITLLLQAATVSLLAVACTADVLPDEDAILVPDPTAPIELSGSAPIETSVSAAVTRADDSKLYFKLYAVPSSVGNSWPSSPYINGVSASLEKGSGSSRRITFGAYYWPVGGQQLKFIGVMKASDTSSASISDVSNGNITLTAGQGDDKDILISNNATGTKSSTPGSMTFNRLMAKLIVKPGTENNPVVTCSIAAGSSTATCNVLTDIGSLSNESGSYTISYSTNSATQIYYLIPGTTISKLTNVVAEGINKGEVALTNSNGTATSFTPQAGKSYTIEVTAKYLIVKVNSPGNWGNGGDIQLQ